MQRSSGKTVFRGIAMGPAVVLKKKDETVERQKIEDVYHEIARFEEAKEASKEQLQKLYEKAVKEVGETSAAIFEVHQMMLDDDVYTDAILQMIRTECINAEFAVAVTGDDLSEVFANMEDDQMKARAADIKDISDRLIRNLNGGEEIDLAGMEPSIIVADDLTPSETVQMDKEKILALVTVHGSADSHTAILARTMDIPALIGVPMDLEQVHTGMTVIADGIRGEVIFDPTLEAVERAEGQIKEEQERQDIWDGSPGGPISGWSFLQSLVHTLSL